MSYYKKIVGERIYLSPRGASEEENELFTKWLNDAEVTDYLAVSARVYNPLSEKDYLEKSAMSRGDRAFNIVELETDRLIGSVALNDIAWSDRTAELGIFIGEEDFRSHGYGTEAIRLILEYGFKYLDLHSVRLKVIAENERAHKCYLKCGFKDTGRSREELFVGGKYHDVISMDILEGEFEGGEMRNKVL